MFMEMSEVEKEQTIRRNLEFLLQEFPNYIKRLESLENNFDSNVGWKEFKFCFKLGTGQIVSNLILFFLIFSLINNFSSSRTASSRSWWSIKEPCRVLYCGSVIWCTEVTLSTQ